MNPGAALELRDIHLPDAPGWWPPAPGWWLLTLLLLAAAFWLWRVLAGYLRLRRERRALREALASVRAQPAATAEDSVLRLAALSDLLRRACKRHAPAALLLHGEAWLQFLDQGLPDAPFSTGPGRLLLDGPYQRAVEPAAVDVLFALVERRLEALPGAGR